MTATLRDPTPAQPRSPALAAMRQRHTPKWLANLVDSLFRYACQTMAVSILVLAAFLVAVLIWRAGESIQANGIAFFTTMAWDPEPTHREFGALAFVYGTIVTSIIAMLVAVPLGVGTSAFLAEIAPPRLRRVGSFLVE